MNIKWAFKTKTSGFTIVELLIVIVIIGILAALVIVMYVGVQNRANDASIQADLNNIGKKFEVYNAQEGVYPPSSKLAAGGLNIKVSKSAYYDNYNMLYCIIAGTATQRFAFASQSKSGKWFIYSSASGGVKSYAGLSGGYAASCTAAGVDSAESGFYGGWGFNANNSGLWETWIKG